MRAFPFERAWREGLRAADGARVQGQLGGFFHDDDQLRRHERVAAKSQQSVIRQEHS